ncbi:DPP1 Diacylglycerol pyrophosphate phosphatase 1 [Candida maltosa Xu316]|uniref:Phosphatidic acid phosphatase type 2/haloperoxidase domain-containing protein n=1 Tax=Candida maltosa (strain Xu316) TaxID=1245528 RepID=M3J5F5_CANMX|nr:hypothetical protein G210_2402 [Candida maltosa Xu316]
MGAFDVINYFHRKDSRFNRITLGFESPNFIKWRVSDIFLVAVFVVVFFITPKLKPFHRQFTLDDTTIQHPFAERETVNVIELFIYSTVTPIIITFVTALILTAPKYKIYNTYVATLGLFLSVLITSVVTDISKNWIGRLRPDFLARCEPDKEAPRNQLVSIEVCTTSDMHRLEDGFRTTPSGHSSISFAGLFYLTLFLLGQTQAWNTKTGSLRTVVCFIPFMVAAWIALSRTQDYRHHFVDVFIGSCLGLVIGSWQYFRLFPWIGHKKSYSNLIIVEEEEEEEFKDDSNYTRLTDSSNV